MYDNFIYLCSYIVIAFICRITNIIVQQQVKMNTSWLRIFAGYSRFALQQQRKHNRVFSTLFQPEAYKKFYLNEHLMEGLNHMSQMSSSVSRLNFINLMQKNEIFNIDKLRIIEHKSENIQNKINALQYEANDGIQDRLVVNTLKSINAETVSVFDGHGGDKLSDYCANHVVELIDSFLQKNKNQEMYVNDTDKLISDSLVYAYEKLDKDFYENVFKPLAALNNRKIKGVGSCALTVIIYNKKIYVANCGDSEAIAVLKDVSGNISYIELNQRFSVNNPIERKRLKDQFPKDNDIIIQQGNGCFYLKGRLQPTRALGDYHLKHEHLFRGKGQFHGPYIKNTPDIKIFQIKQNFQSIVVGSDGIWDFMKKQQIAQYSLQSNPHQKILQMTLLRVAQLHKKTVNQIKSIQISQKRAYHDDISVAVVSLGAKSKQIQLL